MTTEAGQNLMAHATQTIEVGSKSFAAAAKLFPPATRRAVLMSVPTGLWTRAAFSA